MDRPTRRFGLPSGTPGGLAAAGVFGGVLVLAILDLQGILTATDGRLPATGLLELLAAAVVAAGGAILARRLRVAAGTLEHTAREAEAATTRLRVLVEHVPAVVYIDMADPDVTDGGRLAYMSPQITTLLGYRPEEFVDDPELWPSRIHPDDRGDALAAYEAHWQTGEPLRAEYRMLARDGREVWVRDEAYAMPDDSRSGHRVSQGLLADTTDRKRLESKLIHDALHDPLTGLANRVLLRDHAERALAKLDRHRGTVALLFVDLDDFKRVNDSFGHAAGDEILCRVAERLVAAVRTEDVVARQSGDEFAVLLEQAHGDEEVRALASRILTELRRPMQLGGHSIAVGGSIGIAVATAPDTAAEDLLIQADAAMYAAKGADKGTFALYDAGMAVRTWTELEAAG